MNKVFHRDRTFSEEEHNLGNVWEFQGYPSLGKSKCIDCHVKIREGLKCSSTFHCGGNVLSLDVRSLETHLNGIHACDCLNSAAVRLRQNMKIYFHVHIHLAIKRSRLTFPNNLSERVYDGAPIIRTGETRAARLIFRTEAFPATLSSSVKLFIHIDSIFAINYAGNPQRLAEGGEDNWRLGVHGRNEHR